MNKKLLAIAIGAALAAPVYVAQADVKIGGQAHVSADYVDTFDSAASIHDQKVWNISSNVSNIYVKADEDLGGGMKGIFFLQEYFRLDDNGGATQTGQNNAYASPTMNGGTRMHDAPAYVGLSSGMGTILMGNQDTATKLTNRAVDLFNNQIGDSRNAGADNTRAQNSISYTSPTFAGVTMGLMHSTNLDNGLVTPLTTSANGYAPVAPATSTNTTQKYGDVVNVKYEGGPVMVSASYMRLDDRLNGSTSYTAQQVTDLAGSFKVGPVRLVAMYQQNKNLTNVAGASDQQVWGAGAAFTFGSETIKGQFYSRNNQAFTVGRNSTIWAVGYDHAFSKTFTGYVAYAAADNNIGANIGMAGGGGHGDSPANTTGGGTGGYGGAQQNGGSIGVIYNF